MRILFSTCMPFCWPRLVLHMCIYMLQQTETITFYSKIGSREVMTCLHEARSKIDARCRLVWSGTLVLLLQDMAMQAYSPAHLRNNRMFMCILVLLIIGCVWIIPCCITLPEHSSAAMHSRSLCQVHPSSKENPPDRVMRAEESTCRCFWSMDMTA